MSDVTTRTQVNLEVDVLGKYVERSFVSVLERIETLEQQVSLLTAAAKKNKSSSSSSAGSAALDERIGLLEHKVVNRDLIIDSLEARLEKLEKR